MSLYNYLLLYAFITSTALCSQELPVSADYTTAIQLTFTGRKCQYGPTSAPKGFGKVNEIKACDKQDIFTFEKEHNSAWYTFTCPEDGDLIFEIIPENPQNDYDFMLYKYKDTSFYNQLLKRNILPVMCNLARSGKGGRSITGLSYLSSDVYTSVGPGNSYSKPLTVKKGESFVLVVDNVYPKGKGHTINMYYLRDIKISGTIQDDNKQNLAASISLQDISGHIIENTVSDTNGTYHLNTKILDTESYSLIYFNDSTFSNCMQINSGFLSRNNYELNNLKIILPKLKQGKKYLLSSVCFQNNTAKLMSSSLPMLNNLADMIKRNTSMNIQIEGHVNSPGNPVNAGKESVLSNGRAKAIYDYLLSKGIEKERINYTSYGSLYMLYPKANSQKEFEANDRIEVFITNK